MEARSRSDDAATETYYLGDFDGHGRGFDLDKAGNNNKGQDIV